MNKLTRILTIFCIVLLSGVLINAKFNPTNEEVSDKLTEEKSDDTYKIRALKIPDGVNFAGELVPIDIPDIRERMDRELLVNTYW